MTTIVGDWSRRLIVADSQVSDDDSNTKAFNQDKVFKVPQGWLAGAGDVRSIQVVHKWFLDGKKGKPPVIKETEDADFMLLTDDGLMLSDRTLNFWYVTSYDAIGNGANAALAVLALGHTAEEAVWAACQSELYSGEPVKVYTLQNNKPFIWKRNDTAISQSKGTQTSAVGERPDTPEVPYAQH